MLTEFIHRKLKEAQYKLLKDGTYFGQIPGLKGVWSNAENLEECREELREVLEDWMFLKIQNRDKIPGLKVKMGQREILKV